MGAGLTAAAVSAFFGLCVPTVNQGNIEGAFPSKLVVPLNATEKAGLNDNEKAAYNWAIERGGGAFRVRSDAGFLMMTTTRRGACRIIARDGDIKAGLRQFRGLLKTVGAKEGRFEQPVVGPVHLDAVIVLPKRGAETLVFDALGNRQSDFVMLAFGEYW
jgi:hypothetical protein